MKWDLPFQNTFYVIQANMGDGLTVNIILSIKNDFLSRLPQVFHLMSIQSILFHKGNFDMVISNSSRSWVPLLAITLWKNPKQVEVRVAALVNQ